MLSPDRTIPIPGLPNILVFADDKSPSSFFAVSAKPRLARDDASGKQINLVVYGKQTGGVFEPTGGFLSLTVSIGLRSDEEERLIAELKSYVARNSSISAPVPILLGFPWTQGSVTLSLTADITATGQPSMAGDNRCSFSIKLNAAQAKAVSAAWQNHLRDSSVRYEIGVQAGPPSRSQTEYRSSHSSTRDQDRSAASTTASVTFSSTQAAPLKMTFAGPLDLSDEDLKSRSSQVAM